MIKYINGNCLQISSTKRCIIHVCNNKGGFGAGFAKVLAIKHPLVKKSYQRWYNQSILLPANSSEFKLGDNQFVIVGENLLVVNMLCQNGYKSTYNPLPLNYNALNKCLREVNLELNEDVEIWLPDLIGCGLAGGDREKVLELIDYNLKNKKVKIFKL